MDILDSLLEEHGRLRKLATALDAVASQPDWPACPPLPRAAAKELEAARSRFARALKVHEDLEERFVEETLVLAPETGALIGRMITDHRMLDDIAMMLDSLVRLNEEPYSIRFTICRLSRDLERHLEGEEKILFPALRDALSPADLQTLTWRLRRKPAGALQ